MDIRRRRLGWCEGAKTMFNGHEQQQPSAPQAKGRYDPNAKQHHSLKRDDVPKGNLRDQQSFSYSIEKGHAMQQYAMLCYATKAPNALLHSYLTLPRCNVSSLRALSVLAADWLVSLDGPQSNVCAVLVVSWVVLGVVPPDRPLARKNLSLWVSLGAGSWAGAVEEQVVVLVDGEWSALAVASHRLGTSGVPPDSLTCENH